VGHKEFLILARDVDVPLQGHIKNFEVMVCQDKLPLERVQVLLIAHPVASLSGLQATEVSRVAPVLAKSLVGDQVVGEAFKAVESEDSMAAYTNKRPMYVSMDVECFIHTIGLDYDEIHDTWRKEQCLEV